MCHLQIFGVEHDFGLIDVDNALGNSNGWSNSCDISHTRDERLVLFHSLHITTSPQISW